MWTVTNTWGNKTAPLLQAVSSNLIPVAPTIDGIRQGLQWAVEHIGDYEARARGARVQWSTDWKQCFNETFMARIKEFMEAGPGETTAGISSRAA